MPPRSDEGIRVHDDAHAIADALIEEQGLESAIKTVLDSTLAAYDEGDNYSVSVWREVKRVLRDRKSESA